MINILHYINPKLICVISDEDLGICTAMDEFDQIKHILCIKHKIANILKLISSTNSKREEFEKYLYSMFYTRDEFFARKMYHKIICNFPSLAEYFEENVKPISHKLLVSMRPDVFFYNHTSSQLGESYNNMIKRNLSGKIMHFKEIREHVIQKFKIKNNLEKQTRESAFPYHHVIRDHYKINISKNICEIINIEYENSNNIEIISSGEDFIAKEETSNYLVNFENCQCKFPFQAGLPCRHIIALYRKHNLDFPVHLINKRFLLDNYDKSDDQKQIPKNDFEEEIYDLEDEDYDFLGYEEDMTEEEIYEEETLEEKESMDEIWCSYKYTSELRGNIGNLKQKSISIKRYSELLHISKEISKIGSQTQNLYEQILQELNHLHNKYRKRPRNGEVIEAAGRKRGRRSHRHSKNSLIKSKK